MADVDLKAAQQMGPMSAKEREQMVQAVEAAQAAQRAQNAATSLRQKARIATDSKTRERYLQDAYAKEVEANGMSNRARRMQSGAWQGLAAGGGIGAGVGMGLGTVLGALVGGLVSIPTTALGGLVGTGVGAVHGPFIKLGSGIKKRFEDANPSEIVEAMELSKGTSATKATLEPFEEAERLEASPAAAPTTEEQKPPKKKPRKIEIRSGKLPTESTENIESPRRPKKLEVRTPSTSSRPSMSRNSTSYSGKYSRPVTAG